MFRLINADIPDDSSVEEVGLSSTRAWEALQRPDFKDAEEANKAPYCIAYNTDLDMFDYWKEVRPDFAQRGNLAFSGEIKLGQYLACE